jgi:hypothetical protein
MGGQGEYPIDMPPEQILEKMKNNNGCKRGVIKKILIAEAPNHPGTYFYNPINPIVPNEPFYAPIKEVLFPGRVFTNRTDFLIACASVGFLLMDLFPYDGDVYKKANNARRNNSYKSAFCGYPYRYCGHPTGFPYNILNRLTSLAPHIQESFAIAFALKRFGDVILNDAHCVAEFNTWLHHNSKILLPGGALDVLRHIPVAGASKFLRVVGSRGSFGPKATLLSQAGFLHARFKKVLNNL